MGMKVQHDSVPARLFSQGPRSWRLMLDEEWPVENLMFAGDVYQHLSELDISENRLESVDVSSLQSLTCFRCSNNRLHSLKINGTSLNLLIANNNCLKTVAVRPTPQNLQLINLSHNLLSNVPSWVPDCRQLQKLNVSANRIGVIPPSLFDCRHLTTLMVQDNEIRSLELSAGADLMLEEVILYRNMLSHLPQQLFKRAKRLRILNASNNRLTTLPLPQGEKSPMQELYLTANCLTQDFFNCFQSLTKLKVLHMSYNSISLIAESELGLLVELEELCIGGNLLNSLPYTVTELPQLLTLRAHSCTIHRIPRLSTCAQLREVDLSCNALEEIDLASLTPPSLRSLDVSGNPSLQMENFRKYCYSRCVELVDTQCRNGRPVPTAPVHHPTTTEQPWALGFAESQGANEKLCISQLRLPTWSNSKRYSWTPQPTDRWSNTTESLLGMFDGGTNDEIPRMMTSMLPEILQDEIKAQTKIEGNTEYLRYALLTANRELKSLGQRQSASATICHVCQEGNGSVLRVANVGNVGGVLCRSGEPIPLTRDFTIGKDLKESHRLRQLHTVISEDGHIGSGVSVSRSLGAGHHHPGVIPDPHCLEIPLDDADEMLIIANHRLWDVMSEQEACAEIREVMNPQACAKKLQTLAQSYGVRDNLSVIVLRFQRAQQIKIIKPAEILTKLQENEESLPKEEKAEEEDEIGDVKDSSLISKDSLETSLEIKSVEENMDRPEEKEKREGFKHVLRELKGKFHEETSEAEEDRSMRSTLSRAKMKWSKSSENLFSKQSCSFRRMSSSMDALNDQIVYEESPTNLHKEMHHKEEKLEQTQGIHHKNSDRLAPVFIERHAPVHNGRMVTRFDPVPEVVQRPWPPPPPRSELEKNIVGAKSKLQPINSRLLEPPKPDVIFSQRYRTDSNSNFQNTPMDNFQVCQRDSCARTSKLRLHDADGETSMSSSADTVQNGHLADSEGTDDTEHSAVEITQEQLRCWEYMLEFNTKMLFHKELERSIPKNSTKTRTQENKKLPFDFGRIRQSLPKPKKSKILSMGQSFLDVTLPRKLTSSDTRQQAPFVGEILDNTQLESLPLEEQIERYWDTPVTEL